MSWDIIGQDRAIALLRRAVHDESRLSHAYLFVGPEHVGRATTARRFAQALNCPSDERPCGECRICRLIEEGKHPDVETLAPGGVCDESEHKDHEGSREIRICQIRRLEKVVSRAPFEARRRVVIVDPAEAMTVEAANAFLKTLEEPPGNVVLVLVAAREQRLLDTVRSRCRRVTFSGVPRSEIESSLIQRWSVDPVLAERLSRIAQGRLGWAVIAAQNDRVLIERDRSFDEVRTALDGGTTERFAYAEILGRRFSQDATGVDAALSVWEDLWRDSFLTAAQRQDLVSDPGRLDSLNTFGAQYGVEGTLRLLLSVRETRKRLEENASPTLAIEAMLLDIPPGARGRR
jgi:DNA polymerase-3 subunit delta'